jgi:hypothetical protein
LQLAASLNADLEARDLCTGMAREGFPAKHLGCSTALTLNVEKAPRLRRKGFSTAVADWSKDKYEMKSGIGPPLETTVNCSPNFVKTRDRPGIPDCPLGDREMCGIVACMPIPKTLPDEPFFALEKISTRLQEYAEHLDPHARALEEAARPDLLEACSIFHRSRYKLGKSLATYRRIYSGGCWLKVADAVAESLECVPRTIRGYIARYERVAHLDQNIAKELYRQRKEAQEPLIEALQGVETESPNGAAEAIHEAEMSLGQIAEEEGEDEAPAPITPEEKAFARLNDSLGHRLDRIAPPRRLEMIERAVAAQLWAVGIRDEITITIRPRPANVTLSLRKKCCNREPEILLSDKLRA